MTQSPSVERPSGPASHTLVSQPVSILLLGLAGLCGALLTPRLGWLGSVPLYFNWSLMFPMVAALAFGPLAGLAAACTGPVLIPWLLWSQVGWAALAFSVNCLTWIGWIGVCVAARRRSAAWWNHPAMAPLPVLTMTLALGVMLIPWLAQSHNGAPPPVPPSQSPSPLILTDLAIKQIANFAFALLAARCFLKVPVLRRLLGMPAPAHYRRNGAVLTLTLLAILVMSGAVIGLDRLLTAGTGDPAGLGRATEQISLSVMAALMLSGGLLACLFVERQTRITDALREIQEKLHSSEERFDLAMQASDDGLIDWLPREKRLYLSPRWKAMLGYEASPDTLQPFNWTKLLHPQDRMLALRALRRALRVGQRVRLDYRAAHRDGGYRHYSTCALIVRGSDQLPIRVIGTQRDITDRVQAEQRHKQAEAVFNSAREGILVCDSSGSIVASNPAFSALIGCSEDALRGQSLSSLDGSPEQQANATAIKAAFARADHWQGTVWLRRQNGDLVAQWLSISAVRDHDGQALNFVGVCTDVTAIRHSASQMEFLAHHDPLTKLPNRLLLKSRLNHALVMARRHSSKGAVLFIDLDYFKQVNDTLGHRAGDELLQQAVSRMRSRLRDSDTLARLGGDEFVAVLEEISGADDAAVVAAKLIEQISRPFPLTGDQMARIGCSIGISLFPNDGVDADELMHAADLALYQAKDEGRGRYCFVNRDQTVSAQKRLSSNSALDDAISSGGLMLYFQPVVSLVDGKVTGTEALLRWRDSDGKLLTPDKFMPMADNTSLMVRLGDWVLQQACRTMKSWMDDGIDLGSMTVNLSMQQFKMHDLRDRIDTVLQASGLPPHRLELDITEAAVMPRGDDPLSRLKDLKSLGLRLALDDFGTGYSSFAKLGHYPVDKIKVDRKFVHEIDDTAFGTAAAIVAMANLLNIPVQAEGIETEWQREVLLRSHCDAGQGYLFSHPMPEGEFRIWYHNNQPSTDTDLDI